MRELIKKVNKTLDEVNRGYFKILFGILTTCFYHSILNQEKIREMLGIPSNIFFKSLGIVGIAIGILFLTMGIFEITLKEKKEDQKC